MFYDDTVNSAWYVNNIIPQFSAELTDEERLYGVFLEDSAKAHMAHERLEAQNLVSVAA
jgi:hypothetical protein